MVKPFRIVHRVCSAEIILPPANRAVMLFDKPGTNYRRSSVAIFLKNFCLSPFPPPPSARRRLFKLLQTFFNILAELHLAFENTARPAHNARPF
ncbi:MAG: hypothetical protein A2521_17375 [Deltaproteobacteria bacterium RIFOXYD12_FULL_57_12]|nr:MAG: hypothetical protein A2521_17375 [Deltaproteobacteria bacterium RIFOXYD12_FULL_57_12]